MNVQKWYNIASVAVISLLAIFLFSKGCSGEKLGEVLKGMAPDTEVSIKVDTLIVRDTVREVKLDTFYQEKIVYLEKIVPADPVIVYLPAIGDTIKYYSGVAEDSTISITYNATVIGSLEELNLGYQYKKPTLIEKTITETVNKTETITKTVYKGGFYFGGGSRFQSGKSLIPTANAGYLTKKGWYIGYTYEPTLNSHTLNINKRLF